MKRRNMNVVSVEPTVDVSDPAAAAADASAQPQSFDALVQRCLGFVARNGPAEEYNEALIAVRALRKQLSLARNPPIDDCINANLVPAFITMLAHPEAKLQFEAAWCLTNIASGTSKQCEVVVNAGGVPPLVGLMGSASLDVSEQAVWAVGNIAGDCAQMRDLVLAAGATERVLKLVEATASMGQMGPLRNAVWALSNLMRGKPQPSFTHVSQAVPTLTKLLSLDDEEVLMDTCWAMSYVTDGGDDRIDLVVQHGSVGPLMAVLRDRHDSKARTPALRTLCNVLTGSNDATQAVIDAGILEVLPESIRSTKAQTRKEACWAISNIAAGTSQQVDRVVQSPLLAVVIERLDGDDFDVKKEAAWVVANILHGFAAEPSAQTASRASTLVSLGAMKPMVKMLEVNDAAMQKLMLEACGTLLEAGELLATGKATQNPFLVPFDEAEGVDKLESLQTHHNEDVYNKAVALLEKYFGEDGDDDENLLPQTAADGGFTFGAPAPAAFGVNPAANVGFAF
jgi:importin subunit alpha-1